jgi:hypothetical protein
MVISKRAFWRSTKGGIMLISGIVWPAACEFNSDKLKMDNEGEVLRRCLSQRWTRFIGFGEKLLPRLKIHLQICSSS